MTLMLKFWGFFLIMENVRGCSPYHNTFPAIFWILLIAQVVYEMLRALDIDILRAYEAFAGTFFVGATVFKQVMSRIQRKKRRYIFDLITKDWDTTDDIGEVKILEENSRSGRQISLFYVATLGISFVIYGTLGMTVESMKYLIVANQTQLVKELPLPLYRPWDLSEHSFLFCLELGVEVIAMVFLASVHITHDTVYLMQVQHICALLNIVSYRMQKAVEVEVPAKDDKESDEANNAQFLRSAIDLHCQVLEMVDSVEQCYKLTWFVSLLMNTVGVGLGFTLVLSAKEDPVQFVRYLVMCTSALVHFYFAFLPGQNLIDESERISYDCYDVEWYSCSKSTKMSLLLMMVRSQRYCYLTGGDIIILCMETYANMMKSGFSFFTLLSSFS